MPKVTLAAARINANLTQAQAAKALGVGLSTLKNWEQGKTYPNQPAIEKICELYGMPYDYIKFA